LQENLHRLAQASPNREKSTEFSSPWSKKTQSFFAAMTQQHLESETF